MSSAAMAGDGYYTWVDAQGRIHNDPIAPSAKSEEKISPPGDDNEYFTEEEVQRRLEKYDEDNPAFYIWTDSEGRVQTQTYDAEAEQESATSVVVDDDAVIGWDPLLAPPFRVAPAVTSGLCCEMFSGEFQLLTEQFKSLQLFDPVRYRSFPTKTGKHSAWYVDIGAMPSDWRGRRFLVLRLRGAPAKASLIVLNNARKPIYSEENIALESYPETWRSVPYQEARILIEDRDVSSFILYLDIKPAEDMSLEIRWADGYDPFQN
ncbi:MAG: DUF4124 domain-containing protein [Thalassolituus sp.]